MNINELGVWEQLQKKMTWEQLGMINDKIILDFGSGNGVMASHYAETNHVIAIEPDANVLVNEAKNIKFEQICGNVQELQKFEDNYFDIILCHNVFEYAEEREDIMKRFARIIKKNGILSILKHNLPGRVMQMTVLLNNFNTANKLLDGKNGTSEKYGDIHYYKDKDLIQWADEFYVEQVFGQRTFWDLQQNQEIQKENDWQQNMLQLEHRVSSIKEYIEIAFFHHIILIRK
jgi:Methylase involved in ubiquinone/menaquinone biosynthesis